MERATDTRERRPPGPSFVRTIKPDTWIVIAVMLAGWLMTFSELKTRVADIEAEIRTRLDRLEARMDSFEERERAWVQAIEGRLSAVEAKQDNILARLPRED